MNSPRFARQLSGTRTRSLRRTATFRDGQSERVVRAGEMAVVDANQPHGFTNSGPGALRQVDVHLSPKFVTEWLE